MCNADLGKPGDERGCRFAAKGIVQRAERIGCRSAAPQRERKRSSWRGRTPTAGLVQRCGLRYACDMHRAEDGRQGESASG